MSPTTINPLVIGVGRAWNGFPFKSCRGIYFDCAGKGLFFFVMSKSYYWQWVEKMGGMEPVLANSDNVFVAECRKELTDEEIHILSFFRDGKFLNRLTELEQTVLVGYVVENKTAAELAFFTGRSVRHVYRIFNNLAVKLQMFIKEKGKYDHTNNHRSGSEQIWSEGWKGMA